MNDLASDPASLSQQGVFTSRPAEQRITVRSYERVTIYPVLTQQYLSTCAELVDECEHTSRTLCIKILRQNNYSGQNSPHQMCCPLPSTSKEPPVSSDQTRISSVTLWTQEDPVLIYEKRVLSAPRGLQESRHQCPWLWIGGQRNERHTIHTVAYCVSDCTWTIQSMCAPIRATACRRLNMQHPNSLHTNSKT